MHKHLFGLLRKTLGVILIIAGIISGFIPIVQGWLLILAGLLLLGVKKKTIRGWMGKIKNWFKGSKSKE